MAVSTKLQSVANYFLYVANRSGMSINNKKLQKLVYYAQAWHLVLCNDSLFEDQIEAWVNGPVVKDLWSQYNVHYTGPIPAAQVMEPSLTPEVKRVLDEVWQVYGKFDADYLVELVHSESPWLKAREGLDENLPSRREITIESMREYYALVLEDAQK